MPRAASSVGVGRRVKREIACTRRSVSGGLKKRAGDGWGLVGKKERSLPDLTRR